MTASDAEKAVAQLAPTGLLHSPPTGRELQLAILNEFLAGHTDAAGDLLTQLNDEDLQHLSDALSELAEWAGTVWWDRGGRDGD